MQRNRKSTNRKVSERKRKRPDHSADDDDLVASARKTTGRELTRVDEIGAQLATLVELLDQKGIISKGEYDRTVAMRLHEISKATAFEELDEEI